MAITKKTAPDAVEGVMVDLGISQKKMADKMGLRVQQAVYNMLSAKNGMRTDNFIKAMDVLGYDVVIRNRVTDEEVQIIEGPRTPRESEAK